MNHEARIRELEEALRGVLPYVPLTIRGRTHEDTARGKAALDAARAALATPHDSAVSDTPE